MIRVALPYHLRNLAGLDAEVTIEVAGPVTIRAVLDALEAKHPVLRGTSRDHGTLKRRPFIRFFACRESCRSILRMRQYPVKWRMALNRF